MYVISGWSTVWKCQTQSQKQKSQWTRVSTNQRPGSKIHMSSKHNHSSFTKNDVSPEWIKENNSLTSQQCSWAKITAPSKLSNNQNSVEWPEKARSESQSKQSMYSYTLTFSRLERENLGQLQIPNTRDLFLYQPLQPPTSMQELTINLPKILVCKESAI